MSRAVWVLVCALVAGVLARNQCPNGNCSYVPDSDAVSFLSTETTTMGRRYCEFLGDTHVRGNMNHAMGGYWNVMGVAEWNVLTSPTYSGIGTYFSYQATQSYWQSSGCQPRRPDITVGREWAVKCDDLYVVGEAPRAISGMSHCNPDGINSRQTEYTRLFVKGARTDGQNYDFEHMPVSSGNRYYFNLKNGGTAEIYVQRWYCENGCTRGTPNHGTPYDVYVYCGDKNSEDRVEVRNYPHGGVFSGTHMHGYVSIPDSNRANARVRNGNVASGFCGGWANKPSIFSNHCRNKWWYHDNNCKWGFRVKDYESIFKLMQDKTRGKSPSYDAVAWDDNGGSSSQQSDPTRMTQARNVCTSLRQSSGLDNRQAHELNPTTSKLDDILVAVVEECAEDWYYDLPWGNAEMQAAFCDSVADQVKAERQDIKCAAQGYQSVQFATNHISAAGMDATATSALEDGSELVTAYMSEIGASMDNIVWWDSGVCAIADTDVSGLNCATHVYTNTRLTQGNTNTIG